MNSYKVIKESNKLFIIVINLILFFTLISKGKPFKISIFNVYPNDLIATFVLILGFFKLNNKIWSNSKKFLLPIFIIFAIFIFNFFYGYSIYKKTAFVHFRAYYYTFSAMFYFTTIVINIKRLNTLIKISLFYSLLLIIIHFGYLLNLPLIKNIFPIYSSQIFSSQTIQRILNSEQVLFLNIILLFYISIIYINKYKIRNIERLLIFFLIVSIIIAQVRSVWGSFFFTIIFLLFFGEKVQFKMKVFSFIFILFLITLAFYSKIHIIIDVVENAYNQIFSYNSSAHWRIDSWNQLIHMPKGIEFIKGVPFGRSYGRYLWTGQFIENSPHNYYLHTFIAAGLIGFILFVYLLIKLLVSYIKLYKYSNYQIKLWCLFFVLIIVNYLIFFVSYDGTQIFGMFIGISISYIRYYHIISQFPKTNNLKNNIHIV